MSELVPNPEHRRIGAIVLAAGLSTRMGMPKMTLPWEDSTILGKVLDTLRAAALDEIIVVTGAVREAVEEICRQHPGVQTVFNPKFKNGEMTDSIRVGLQSLSREDVAVLIVLGDQPAIQVDVIAGILRQYREGGNAIIAPSYQMRRGHPWLIAKPLWLELSRVDSSFTMRDFLRTHAGDIYYLLVDTPSVLMDLDTLEDYRKARENTHKNCA
jgi:molybdenum cofactor cytidylyltransferase